MDGHVFFQKPPNDIYVPTLHSTSLKALLDRAVYDEPQMDVKTACLNAPLKEEILIPLPTGGNGVAKLQWIATGVEVAEDIRCSHASTHINVSQKNSSFTRLYVGSRPGRCIDAPVFVMIDSLNGRSMILEKQMKSRISIQ